MKKSNQENRKNNLLIKIVQTAIEETSPSIIFINKSLSSSTVLTTIYKLTFCNHSTLTKTFINKKKITITTSISIKITNEIRMYLEVIFQKTWIKLN